MTAKWHPELGLQQFQLQMGNTCVKPVSHQNLGAVQHKLSIKRPRVLIADNDPTFLLLLADALAGEGFDVETAAVIELAELVLASGRVDVLLVDVQVGTSNGLDLVRRLRSVESTGRLPVVVVSARVGSESQALALAAGVDGFVAKPLEVSELAELVRELLVSQG